MTADEWNKHVPSGTHVHYLPGDGRVVSGTTGGPAFVMSSGLHVVIVRFEFNHSPSYAEFILLSHLRVANPPTAERPPDETTDVEQWWRDISALHAHEERTLHISNRTLTKLLVLLDEARDVRKRTVLCKHFHVAVADGVQTGGGIVCRACYEAMSR